MSDTQIIFYQVLIDKRIAPYHPRHIYTRHEDGSGALLYFHHDDHYEEFLKEEYKEYFAEHSEIPVGTASLGDYSTVKLHLPLSDYNDILHLLETYDSLHMTWQVKNKFYVKTYSIYTANYNSNPNVDIENIKTGFANPNVDLPKAKPKRPDDS